MDSEIADAAMTYATRAGRALPIAPVCPDRSPEIGTRNTCACVERGRRVPVYVCRVRLRKVTAAECALCQTPKGGA